MINEYDDGGANAIRGFNYQKAVIAYIAICNLSENDFYIIPENKEDIEVYKQGKTAHIQVKSASLSITKLLAEPSNKGKPNEKKPSIIAKLIQKTGCDKFKIATTNAFAKKDFGNLIENKGEFCDHGIYRLSNEQKIIIKEELKKTKRFSEEFIDKRINQIYIMISMFSNDLTNATSNLLGLMVQKNIKVDHNLGNTSLNELFTQIDQKSEVNHKYLDDPMIERKIIKSDDLQKIFHATLDEEKVNNIRLLFLDDCQFDLETTKLINRSFMSIKVIHRDNLYEIKNKLIYNNQLDFNILFSNSNKKIIKDLYEHNKINGLKSEINYSLLFQALAEIAVEKGYG